MNCHECGAEMPDETWEQVALKDMKVEIKQVSTGTEEKYMTLFIRDSGENFYSCGTFLPAMGFKPYKPHEAKNYEHRVIFRNPTRDAFESIYFKVYRKKV